MPNGDPAIWHNSTNVSLKVEFMLKLEAITMLVWLDKTVVKIRNGIM